MPRALLRSCMLVQRAGMKRIFLLAVMACYLCFAYFLHSRPLGWYVGVCSSEESACRAWLPVCTRLCGHEGRSASAGGVFSGSG